MKKLKEKLISKNKLNDELYSGWFGMANKYWQNFGLFLIAIGALIFVFSQATGQVSIQPPTKELGLLLAIAGFVINIVNS